MSTVKRSSTGSGNKSSKQKRQAAHITKGYTKKGISMKEATMNARIGGASKLTASLNKKRSALVKKGSSLLKKQVSSLKRTSLFKRIKKTSLFKLVSKHLFK